MTDAQRKYFYFPAWNEAVRCNYWFVEPKTKRLQMPADRLSQLGRTVVALAKQRAAAAHRGPSVEDLRHAAQMIAVGRAQAWRQVDALARRERRKPTSAEFEAVYAQRPIGPDKSSQDFDNLEIDLAVTLFNILAQPEWFGTRKKFGLLDWEDPARLQTHRLTNYLESFPDGILRHMAADRFGTRQWETLEFHQLEELASRASRWKHAQGRHSRFALSAPKRAATPAPQQRELQPAAADPDWNV